MLKRTTVMTGLAFGMALVSAAPASAQISFGPIEGSGTHASDPAAERQALKEFERNPEPGFPTLSQANIAATKAAIGRYEEIVAAGGWGTIANVVVKPGEQSDAVPAVRERLKATGELAEANGSQQLDDQLVEAVKAFQRTNGLTPNGRIDAPTVAALNVPAQDRLKQLKTNLTRLNELVGIVKSHKRYVVVNIPAAQVEAVALNKVISRHTGVVGKVDRPTPLLRSTITEMNFNPVWRLPPTVIEKDLIPQGRQLAEEGKNVLVKMGIDAYDGNGRRSTPRRSTGSPRRRSPTRIASRPERTIRSGS